jgi:hypothetical protein
VSSWRSGDERQFDTIQIEHDITAADSSRKILGEIRSTPRPKSRSSAAFGRLPEDYPLRRMGRTGSKGGEASERRVECDLPTGQVDG